MATTIGARLTPHRARRRFPFRGGGNLQHMAEAGSGAQNSDAERDSLSERLRGPAVLSTRFLLVGVAIYVLWSVLSWLALVVLPLVLALLLTALMWPAVAWLRRRRLPRGVAAVLVLVGTLLLLAAIFTFVIDALVSGIGDLTGALNDVVEQTRRWLTEGPLGLEPEQLANATNSVTQWLQDNAQQITSGAASTASTVGEVVAGMVLTLFILIFFLYDGQRIWRFLLQAVPRRSRAMVDTAATQAFWALSSYARATVLVALVDAVGIGIGLALLRVPLALPLAALVFLGGFVPFFGAFVSGLVAVLVALVANGPLVALGALAVVVGVQQLEGNVLEPFIMGRAVRLHPVAVVLVVPTGIILNGIAGALLAVPVVTTIRAAVRAVRATEESEENGENGTDTPVPA